MPETNTCYTASQVKSLGGLVNQNQDGTVSVFMPSPNGMAPVILTKQCCLALDPTYTFDVMSQKCKWGMPPSCSIENVFKINLNPNGNDGALFTVPDGETCTLNIDFDYLFKFDCSSLFSLINPNLHGQVTQQQYSDLQQQIANLEQQIQNQTTLCETLTNQINELHIQIDGTSYSITCTTTTEVPVPAVETLPTAAKDVFSNTGFNTTPVDGAFPTKEVLQSTLTSYQSVTNTVIYCLTDEGLVAWQNLLGPIAYQAFLNGDPNSYTCQQVNEIYFKNQRILNTQPPSAPLLVPCDTPFGTKTQLINKLTELIIQQTNCNTTLTNLENELTQLNTSAATEVVSQCTKPIDLFESLDVSMTLDIISGNTTQTLYEDTNLFPKIGFGNLYNYLNNNTKTGFYVCGGSSCTPFNLNLNKPYQTNDVTCDNVLTNVLQDLYNESGLSGTTNGYTAFTNSLSNSAFTSSWLHYSTSITDETLLNQLKNQKILVSIKINHVCSDICILLDNIVLDRVCDKVKETNIFVTQSPGFELERIRDNKKSWYANTTPVTREFEIYNYSGASPIRETLYYAEDDRLVINSKEIDLDVSLASAIENDVWCYISDNPCILTGITNCNPCISGCCGDNKIQFNNLMTQPLSAVTTVEDFEYFITSELIDAKNRQTLSSYPTLKALYDRYLNSYVYCGNNSSAYNYYTMEQFANLVGNYWVDLIEQVIPSTTIWGSVKIYSNSIFDEQKHKYKAYTSFFGSNPLSGITVLSPINGLTGNSANVGVDTESLITLTTGGTISTNVPQITTYNSVWLAQMNSGSEFIGSVNIVGPDAFNRSNSNSSINDSSLQLTVSIINGYVAEAIVIGANGPVTYLWSNGDTNPTTDLLGPGSYSVTVTDSKNYTKTLEFTTPVQYQACWYTLPDTTNWIENGFDPYSDVEILETGYTYTLYSMIVNSVEKVTGTKPSYDLIPSNYNPITIGTGKTYTNFVDFLNGAFASVGLSNYKAQLSLNLSKHTYKYYGFYIIKPYGDTFTMTIHETNNMDTIYTQNSATDSMDGSYRGINCSNITIKDGKVIE
jgi:hypothetical protein